MRHPILTIKYKDIGECAAGTHMSERIKISKDYYRNIKPNSESIFSSDKVNFQFVNISYKLACSFCSVGNFRLID